MLDIERADMTKGDEMIARILDGVEIAFDPRDDVVENGQAAFRQSISRAIESILDGRREPPAHMLLMLG